MTMKSERVFLIIMLVMIVVLLSGCAMLEKLRGNLGVPDMLTTVPVIVDGTSSSIDVETPTTVEDVRG